MMQKPIFLILTDSIALPRKYESILSGVSKSIVTYNAVLNKHAEGFVLLDQIPRARVLKDHNHINTIGQLYIFKQIQKQLH